MRALGDGIEREGDRATLLHLALYSDTNGFASPSNGELAAKGHVSERTIERRLSRLEAIGAVVAVEGRSGGRGRVTLWRVLVEPGRVWNPPVNPDKNPDKTPTPGAPEAMSLNFKAIENPDTVPARGGLSPEDFSAEIARLRTCIEPWSPS